MTANPFTPILIKLGAVAMIGSIAGLVWMFVKVPKIIATLQEHEVIPAREFLAPEITPNVLRKKVENRTSVQIDALTKTYAGKWMNVEGRVYDISDVGSTARKKFSVHLIDSENPSGLISITFTEPWIEQLSALNKGDWLTAVGKLQRLQSGASLADGEIVHIGEPPKPSPAPKPRRPRTKKAA